MHGMHRRRKKEEVWLQPNLIQPKQNRKKNGAKIEMSGQVENKQWRIIFAMDSHTSGWDSTSRPSNRQKKKNNLYDFMFLLHHIIRDARFSSMHHYEK